MLSSNKNQVFVSLLIVIIFATTNTFAQTTDSSARKPLTLATTAAITNNGVSLIPTFTLGKPAMLINFTVGRKLTFEPEFRYSLSGKPWANIYWLRYKLVSKEKFHVSMGAHPSVVFSSSQISENSTTKDIIKVQRFVAAEIAPTFTINNHLNIGAYYLTSFGSKESSIKRTNFLTLNASISNLKLFNDYSLRLSPQVYYLKMDSYDGYYYSATATISKSNLPISVQGMFNNPFKSNIKGGQSLVWNMSLVFSFNKLYRSLK